MSQVLVALAKVRISEETPRPQIRRSQVRDAAGSPDARPERFPDCGKPKGVLEFYWTRKVQEEGTRVRTASVRIPFKR